jgi:subtilisin family serine protease
MKILIRAFAFVALALLGGNANAQYYYSDDGKIPLSIDSTLLYVEFGDAAISPLLNVGSIVEFFPSKGTALVDANYSDVIGEFDDVSLGFRLPDGYRVWATRKICVALNVGVNYSQLIPYTLESNSVAYMRGGYYLVEFESSLVAMEMANLIYESGIAKFSHVDFYTPIEKFQDPLFDAQFQMHNVGQTIDGYAGQVDCDVDALEAWDITLGSPNVIVSVIDDGMESHPDFNDSNGTSRLLDGYTPTNGGDGTPTSTGKHGVACAGIISASHDGVGVMGVSPLSKMLSVNIFSGGETTSDLAQAFTWSVDNGADVISNSWGYTSCAASFSNITNAINDAATNGRGGKGCVIVFASGNNNFPCVTYPGKLPSVIAVGAVTNQGQRSWYSNYGSELDLVAPSNGKAGVRTTDRMGSAGYSFTNYTNSFGGTSAACPVVSGVAALVLAVNPNLTAVEIATLLNDTADDMGDVGVDNQYANGRVNALTAIECAIDTSNCESSNGGGGGNPIICDAPTNVSIDYISTTSASFSWDVMATAQSYAVKYKKVGGSTTTLVLAYNNEITLSNLESGTLYEFQVKSDCGNSNLSEFSPMIIFATDDSVIFDPTLYCESYGEYSANGYIDFISLSTITNVSGDDGGYAFFGEDLIFLEQGDEYYISFSKNTPTNNEYMYFSFYIDYDKSHSFEEDELVYKVRKNYNSIYAHPIQVPFETTLGATMLRVIAKKGSYALPCEVFTVGEVEDYIVFLTGDIDVSTDAINSENNFSIFPNPTSGRFSVDSNIEFSSVDVFNVDGRLVVSRAYTSEIDLTSESDGLYIVMFKSKEGVFVKKLLKQ